ncbi:DUF3237 domain-containing protein [Ruegeria sp. HKCCD9179]|uniref:DUF3237 domain-containing protein n=1 Tax=unclassified Ruegeria TaxID=2625375 RepID=UPI001487880C|nr:DUF3237 family protein [Ruegeria sp. HKCCD6109]NOD76950.1 DUF3237 family protein [Ruegeria sp. HKCCD4332]
MREFTDRGVTLRWSETISAAGDKRALIEAGPSVSPHDTVRLICSQAGGPERAIRGWPLHRDPKTGLQHFAATLPSVMQGKSLNWRPVLTSGGREYDPGPDTAPSAAPAQQPKPAQQSPVLEHIAKFTVPFTGDFHISGETPDGIWLHFAIKEGGTVEGPHLKGVIEPVGGDWMRVRPDGVGLLHARALIKPTEGGAPILFEDTGVCEFGPDGYAAVLKGNLPATAPVRLAPRYLTSNPNYSWMNRVQGFGIGEASLSDITLRFDVYSAKGTSDG